MSEPYFSFCKNKDKIIETRTYNMFKNENLEVPLVMI